MLGQQLGLRYGEGELLGLLPQKTNSYTHSYCYLKHAFFTEASKMCVDAFQNA